MFPHAEIFLPDAAATAAAGRDLGLRLAASRRAGPGPDIFLLTLSGDLGAGKTTFCQGLGQGLEVADLREIVSPTFTLANEYRGLLDIFHLDLYRLDSPAEFLAAGRRRGRGVGRSRSGRLQRQAGLQVPL
ncbi:hypothetical protein FACS189460_2110 [Deltaproteobacteria bacterium]|nr:hypothetical protein FACS189460_2110 [Deltaproteobacteria bacterium]